jgi:AcrR family transcriptional regulator
MGTARAGVKRATRAEAAAATRRRVLESARRLFLRDGFGATSLDRVAEEAGLTKGAIYGHFRNKADLFVAMARAGLGIGPTLQSNPPDDLEWPALVRRIAQDVGAAAVGRRELAVHLEILAFALRDRSVLAQVTSELRRTVQSNIRSLDGYPGRPPSVDAERFVKTGIAGVLGLIIHRALAPDLVTAESFEDLLGGLSRRLGGA